MPPAPRKRPVPRRSGLASGELEGRRPAKTPVPRKSAVPRKSGLASGESEARTHLRSLPTLEGRQPAKTPVPRKSAVPRKSGLASKARRAAPPRSLTSKGGIQDIVTRGMTAPQIAALPPVQQLAANQAEWRRMFDARRAAAAKEDAALRRLGRPKRMPSPKAGTLELLAAKELRRVKNKKER